MGWFTEIKYHSVTIWASGWSTLHHIVVLLAWNDTPKWGVSSRQGGLSHE